MTFLTLTQVKMWLRVEEEYTEEDALLEMLVINAESYLRDSVDNFDILLEQPAFKAKAGLLACMLITDWYEKRDLTGIVSDKLRYTFQSLILQLQLTGGGINGTTN